MLSILGVFLFRYSDQSFENQPNLKRAKLLIRFLIVIPLLYLPDFYQELILRHQWKLFYVPIHLWGWIIPSFPDLWVLWLLLFVVVSCSTFLLWAIQKTRSSSLFWFALPIPMVWMVLLASFFGFSKIDHTYSTMYLGTCMLPVLVYSFERSVSYLFSVRILQAFICGSYFFAALEKAFLSGWHWIDPLHFQQLAYLHPTKINGWISTMPGLGSGLLVAGFVFQLLTIFQWRFAFWGYVNLVGAIVFHLGNWLIFNIGGWQSPWIAMVVFLWPGWLKQAKAIPDRR